jgi:hypothetical protein
MRRVLRIVLWTAVTLLALFLAFAVKVVFFPPTFAVAPIQLAPVYQDAKLVAQAWELPVARAFRPAFAFQSNGSTCGPTSLANVSNSFGVPHTEESILDGSGKCSTGICFTGLTLDELSEIARSKTPRKVRVLRGLDYASFRALLPSFNDPKLRYVANFQRGMLMGKGSGHFSPIGGWLEQQDLVFVLDVNEKYRPWLVSAKRLFEAIDTLDGDQKRGLLQLE